MSSSEPTSSQQAGTVTVEARDAARSARLLDADLAYQAAHDSLTGLANRTAFETRLNALIAAAGSPDAPAHVLAYVDLDQFKLVNDTCGHTAGDQLLTAVAELFSTHVDPHDLLARIGGDEFAFILTDCTVEQAKSRMRELHRDLRRFQFKWNGARFDVGASVGLTPVTAANSGIDDVLGQADIACYAAKDGGRNRVEVYGSGPAAQRHLEMRWPARLNRALEAGRLHLASQPIVSLQGREHPRYYEMLLRMRGATGDWIYPGEFIPAAERFNLMPALDRWVASWVLREMLFEQEDAKDHLLSINVSGVSLNDDRFMEWLLHDIQAAGSLARSLSIEITETAAVKNLDNTAQFIRQARQCGCRIALDDFGSGLSSFGYLDKLEVDLIKIDGQFVRSMSNGGVGRHVVSAIAQLAKAMGIEVVAEHVEDAVTVTALTDLGVDYAQGFYFAKPSLVRPYAKLADLPRARTPKVAPRAGFGDSATPLAS